MKVKDPKELARRHPHLEGCLCLDVIGTCRYRPRYYKILTPPGKEGPGCGATWMVRKDELEPLDGDFGVCNPELGWEKKEGEEVVTSD